MHVQANYVVNVTLLKWQYPHEVSNNTCTIMQCCQKTDGYPSCSCITQHIDTTFDICLQPVSFTLTSHSCPYGKYSTTFNDSNITFEPHVNKIGDAPNPMTFNVPTNVSIYQLTYSVISIPVSYLEYFTFIC